VLRKKLFKNRGCVHARRGPGGGRKGVANLVAGGSEREDEGDGQAHAEGWRAVHYNMHTFQDGGFSYETIYAHNRI
jgi:hypothetical protein